MIIAKTLSFIGWAVLSLWSRSLRVRIVNRDMTARFVSPEKKVIYAFWHGSVFLLPYTYRNSGVVIMVSESRDGDLASSMLGHFGFDVIRGSTNRRGNRALISFINSLRSGRSVAIAVDGPRGPRHVAKAGALFLAGKLSVPVIPVATRVKRCWTLDDAWDKFTVPVPFTKGVILLGAPITISGTSREAIEASRRELDVALHHLTQEAATMVGAPLKEGRQAVRSEN